MHSYCVSGLAVKSDINLPGLIAVPSERDPPDVFIHQDSVPRTFDGAASLKGPTWELAGDKVLLTIPGIARFMLTGGRDIAFQPEGDTPPDDIAIFIIGTVFGILLHQREQIVLHASAVRVNNKAVLFCGQSGAGKSTLAAALAQRGFPLVTDDICAITLTAAGIPIVHPDGRQLKLWAHAVDSLELADRRGERVRRRLEKFYVEPGEAFSDSLPLGAVYALREARPPHAPGIERPNVVDGALILRRNAYRPLLVTRMGQKANYFRAATAIANVAGIFHLTRRFDFKAMPECISSLEQHWLDIGLSEKAA